MNQDWLVHNSPPPSGDPDIEEIGLLLRFWVPLAVRNKKETRLSARPYSGGGSGAFTISRKASSSISGSPISGPLALPLAARFGGGLDGLGGRPATGSTVLLR